MDLNQKITLREVIKENLDDVLNLRVTSEQEKFVASNAVSIAQTHFYPEIAWFRAIYLDDLPIGFVMLEIDRDNLHFSLWRLMIDARYQKQGLGQRAVRLIIEQMKACPEVKTLFTSCVAGKGSPKKFYEKIGFRCTGETDEDGELIMYYNLSRKF